MQLRIEFPSTGATYHHEEFGVYEYSVYPRGSVLEGEESRRFLASFTTLEEAQKAYPKADVSGCGYRAVELPQEPPSWFDPMYAGERWSEDD
jgi:hypothetical protein